jgi:hypothetical protein
LTKEEIGRRIRFAGCGRNLKTGKDLSQVEKKA